MTINAGSDSERGKSAHWGAGVLFSHSFVEGRCGMYHASLIDIRNDMYRQLYRIQMHCSYLLSFIIRLDVCERDECDVLYADSRNALSLESRRSAHVYSANTHHCAGSSPS